MPEAPSSRRFCCACAFALLPLAAFTSVAEAQSSAQEIARGELMREAEAAAQRADHAAAIERAQRALALRATPSVQRFLAREHEALGHSVEALALAAACERGAEADASLHNRDTLLRSCRALTARAAERVGRVVVSVEEPLPRELVVRIGGEAFPEALLRVPYAVAPGVVRVDAEAPGYEPVHRDVTVTPGRTEEVRVALVRVPPVVVAPPVEPLPRPMIEPPVTPPVVPQVRPREPSRVPWIAVGVGASALATAGFVTAGASYGLAGQARSERDTLCASPCRMDSPNYPAAAERDGLYRERLTVTTGALVAGSVLAVGATLWWVLARPSVPRATAPVVVTMAPGHVMVAW